MAKKTADSAPPEESVAVAVADDGMPEFNGFPLSEVLANAVIANARTPIYQISGGDQAFQEQWESIADEYRGADRRRQQEVGSQRYQFLWDLGVTAHPGKIIGYVRAGFILNKLGPRQTESAAVAFPKPLGGAHFGCVRWSDFSMGQGQRIAFTFAPYSLTARTLLFDLRDRTDIILANTENEMQKAWLIKCRSGQIGNFTSADAPNSPLPSAPLAVVETKDGLFLGYVVEKDATGLSSMTWEQALADKSQQYYLQKKDDRELKPGSRIFSLFDAKARRQKKIASSNPADFLVYPEVFPDILKKGIWSLTTSFLIPRDSGFEPLQEVETEASFQFEIEKKLNRLQLTFDAIDKESARFLIKADYERREVERTISANGHQTINAKPWKKQSELLNAELKLGTDGALRFTDGELIYQVMMGTFNPELIVYTVERSAFPR